MSKAKMSEEIRQNRRSFLGTAAMSIAAANLGITAFADATPGEAKPSGATAPSPVANTSFGPLKQINAGLLSVGYAEAGPADGPPVIFLIGRMGDLPKHILDIASRRISPRPENYTKIRPSYSARPRSSH